MLHCALCKHTCRHCRQALVINAWHNTPIHLTYISLCTIIAYPLQYITNKTVHPLPIHKTKHTKKAVLLWAIAQHIINFKQKPRAPPSAFRNHIISLNDFVKSSGSWLPYHHTCPHTYARSEHFRTAYRIHFRRNSSLSHSQIVGCHCLEL